MSTGKNTAPEEHHVSPDQLHIGLYVYVDLPWFRHPFTANSFKISSEHQIQELRALKKSRFRCDARLSEGRMENASPASTLATDAPATENIPASKSFPEPTVIEIDPRIQQLRDYRKAVTRTEKSFVKAVGVMRRLNRSLVMGSRAAVDETNGLVDQMVTVFLEHPSVTLHVMSENCGGDEVYDHRLNVCVTCLMLTKGLNLDREQARLLGAGALLHDIGLVETPDHVLKRSSTAQTPPEGELQAKHIANGINIGRQLGLAPEALSIIAQHHELADGSGYPGGLKLEQITPLARIVSLVNFYDNLCNPVNAVQAMTPHEALAFIYARLQNKFDAHILQVMIRALGVYPPGSVVKLSNDAIAIVVSVNPHKPLLPWVMVYDAAVPRKDACMLNLETEDGISISKSVRPALLPATVYGYLSPRKRITYFFDGGTLNGSGQK